MKKYSVFLSIALLSGCSSIPQDQTMVPSIVQPVNSPSAELTDPVEVVFKVVDGDTVKVAGGKTTVRILGIDSPETKDPRKPVQCGGPESSRWASEQLPVGSLVRLVVDPTQGVKDRYQRMLAYVLFRRPDSTQWLDFSVESARAGMSRSYVYNKKPVQKAEEIGAAENIARHAMVGLWACPGNA